MAMDPHEIKAALVTGGSRGLGAQAVLGLSALGYRVAINYLSSKEPALQVAREATGPDIMLLRGDVSSDHDARWMAHAVGRAWGRLDLLVNNAGISRDSLLLKATGADWDEHMKINFTGTLNMMRSMARLMRVSGGGHMVNISSRSGMKGKAGQAAYSASKAAVLGLTLTAAREFSRWGIRVNAVAPGYTPTDMGQAAKGAMDMAREQSLLGTLSDPADLVTFIQWLAGTSTVTGQVFNIDSRI